MRRALLIRLKSCIFSIEMLFSIIAGLVFLMWFFTMSTISYIRNFGALSLTDAGGNYLHNIYFMHAQGGFDLFAPILAALPASTIFCDEYSTGFLRCVLIRENRNRYIRDTWLCSTITGGIAATLPILISSMFFVFIGTPNTPESVLPGSSTFLDQSILSRVQFIWGGGFVVVLLVILAFLFGATWSNMGLCVSTVVPNRYVALASPFAIYFAAHILCFRVERFMAFSPVNVLMPVGSFLPNIVFPFAYQFTLLLASAVLFRQGAIRRVRDV